MQTIFKGLRYQAFLKGASADLSNPTPLVVLKENIKSLNSLKKVIFPFSNIIVAAEEEDPNDQGKFMLSEIIHTSIIRTFLDQIPQLKEDLTKNTTRL